MRNEVDAAGAMVAGERLEDLIPALRQIAERAKRRPDGSVTFRGTFAPDVGVPFWRALMRVEAELMLRDADALKPDSPMRTPEQRGADALVELAQRCAHAREQ